jgi:AbrB family looped-hinge helix DNA binding protein
MLIAVSRVTRQGQISIPADVRRDLGIRPGTQLIWDRRENGEYVVRPKRATWDDLHALVGTLEVRLTDEELKDARRAFLARHADGGR